MANSAGRVQPLLLVKNRRNKLKKRTRKARVSGDKMERRCTVVHSLDELRVLLKRVGITPFRYMCNDQDILNCYFVPRRLYRAFVPRQRLALCMDVAFSGRKYLERTATHGWVAELFNEIFAVGANWADEVGQVKAVLVAQGGC